MISVACICVVALYCMAEVRNIKFIIINTLLVHVVMYVPILPRCAATAEHSVVQSKMSVCSDLA